MMNRSVMTDTDNYEMMAIMLLNLTRQIGLLNLEDLRQHLAAIAGNESEAE